MPAFVSTAELFVIFIQKHAEFGKLHVKYAADFPILVKDDESMVTPEKDTGVAKSAPTEMLIAKSPAVSNVFPEKERLSAMSPIGI